MKIFPNLKGLTARLLLAATLAITAVITSQLALLPAEAAMSYSTTSRTARMQALVTALGSSAKAKAYSGTRPSGTGAVTGGNTLLATVTFGSVIGTVTNGVLTVDAAGSSQSNGSHVSGTPTFIDFTTSGDVVVIRIDYCGSAPCWTFTGAVATGQNVTFTTPTITDGNL